MNVVIRHIKDTDITDLKKVLDSSQLFPSHLLEGMIHEYLTNTSSKEIWFTAEDKGKAISLGYCAPERLTEGTFNLYAIAVDKAYQGKGIGKQMMNYIERTLLQNGNRILIVETSGDPSFHQTREFYGKCNYVRQAVIPEFYAKGEDKVIFWKKLVN